jgi:hypothetical protein
LIDHKEGSCTTVSYSPSPTTPRRGRSGARRPLRAAGLSAALLALTAMLALAAPSLATATSYVSLGDSYTSGPLILPPASGAPLECLQSARDYPHLSASALGLSLHDVSCSGATTENLTTTAQYADQPPQEGALSASTGVVSVGIGGNDNGLFGETLVTCGSEDLVTFGLLNLCKATYGNKLAEEIEADGPVVGGALREIRERSPAAKVFVVGYPDILPQKGKCFPQVPLSEGDVAYLNGVEQDLNAMLGREAAANGDTYVDTYTPSIGHDACKSLPTRWVEPVLPESDAFSVHPNEYGMEHDATDVEAAMRGQGIS